MHSITSMHREYIQAFKICKEVVYAFEYKLIEYKLIDMRTLIHAQLMYDKYDALSRLTKYIMDHKDASI